VNAPMHSGNGSGRVRSPAALTALILVVGCVVITSLLTVWQYRSGVPEPFQTWFETSLGAISYGAMGYLIVSRSRGNRLGPLMLVVGVIGAFQGLFGSVDASSAQLGLSNSLGHWLYAATSACQVLSVAGVVVLLLLAPTGQPLSPRWRWVIWLTVISVGSEATDALIFREELDAGIEPTGAASVVNGALSGVGSLVVLGLLAAPLCLGLRWYRAQGLERQQVSWVAAGGLAGPLLVVFTGLLPKAVLDALNQVEGWVHFSIVWGLAACALPVGIAIAVLRHRLYDIDKVVSRTTSYAVVTGVIVAVYIVIVAVATSLFQLPNQISVAVATLTAAAAFRPVLVRTRAIVDRRFNRSHYDAEQTVQSFARRLRDEVDPETVSGDLLAVLDRTMQPSVSGLWLRDT
jgi:hypothetical protein